MTIRSAGARAQTWPELRHRFAALSSRIVLLVGLLLVAAPTATSQAQDDPGSPDSQFATSDWQPTGLTEPVQRLFTPRSGALFAVAGEQLMRSDDAGVTWRVIPLPTSHLSTWRLGGGRLITDRFVVVDPVDQAIVYVFGTDGLFKTTDDAQTWTQLSLPSLPFTGASPHVRALAVSPADDRVVYATIVSSAGDFGRNVRSDNGGASWVAALRDSGPGDGAFATTRSAPAILCDPLQPHPSDPNRLFVLTCVDRLFTGVVGQSTDRWNSETDWFRPAGPQFGDPTLLVGGAGRAQTRYYVASRTPRDARLFRTDDNGATWSEILHVGPNYPAASDHLSQLVNISGLAYDATVPDTLYVGLSISAPDSIVPGGGTTSAGPIDGKVQWSADAGQSWQDAGQQAIGVVYDVALGIDRQNLYAATDQGVWRLALPDPSTHEAAHLRG